MNREKQKQPYYVVRKAFYLDKKFTNHDDAYEYFKKHQYDFFQPQMIGYNLYIKGQLVKKVYLRKSINRNYIILKD